MRAMTTLSDTDLLQYDKQGLIPGPNDTEETFLERVNYCLKLKEEPSLPLQEEMSHATHLNVPLFHINPTWVPLFFTNYRLAPWHGACAWIFQKEPHSPLGALLQLRKKWKDRAHSLFYSRQELMEHELTHVGRMAFQEPRYEEFFAYHLSPSGWRRRWGPLIQSPHESLLFIIICFFLLLLDFIALFHGSLSLYTSLMPLKLLPATLLIYAISRLALRHYRLSQAYHHLQQHTTEPWAVLYRMTDQEIDDTAKGKPLPPPSHSLRWRSIYLNLNFFR